jgi:FKBP-type peptidyl-prolyl cis-trans isomerase
LQVYELNGQLIADVSETFEIGSASKPLPLAMDKALKMLRQGEQIQIIAPWYTAYGVEGTDEIKGYTNLKIVIGVES